MSLAGPGANFLLMIVGAISIRRGMLAGLFQQPEAIGFTHITEVANPDTASSVLTFAATFASILFFAKSFAWHV
jgi:hypothetical protein